MMILMVVQMVVVVALSLRKFCPEVWSINSRRVISCLVCTLLGPALPPIDGPK